MVALSTAPAIGATQKSQRCAIAQPPTKTATPVLRAGFTEGSHDFSKRRNIS